MEKKDDNKISKRKARQIFCEAICLLDKSSRTKCRAYYPCKAYIKYKELTK